MLQHMKKVPLLQALLKARPDRAKDELHAFIVCRNVYVDGELVSDPKQEVDEGAVFEIRTRTYVSRGGYKLEHALSTFNIDVSGEIFLDAGSSTGGFTDCLLQHGANLVHAVDVGYNLIDWKLRSDHRVVVHEKQNIMTLTELSPPPTAAVCDLSFRSVCKAASHILNLVGNTYLIALIKPQFEMENPPSTFDGVIEDFGLIVQVVKKLFLRLADEGVGVFNLAASPIRGAKGNIEFLALLKKGRGISLDRFTHQVEAQLELLQ